jgi:Clustered mitochondria/Translation initiation factor eIF3 subunit 135
VLPINNTTLIYGSFDRGRHVHADVPAFNKLMVRAAKIIGLKVHRAGTEQPADVAAAFDVEGHRGTDGRYYLLDFARVLPPEGKCRRAGDGAAAAPPRQRIVGGDGGARKVATNLCHLLRPELVFAYVQLHKTPLCSDAYNPQARVHDPERQHEREVDDATYFLHRHVVPNFAQRLPGVIKAWLERGGKLERFRLTEAVHREGINVRHLGRIIAELSNVDHSHTEMCKTLVLAEVCARVIKNRLRAHLRRTTRQTGAILEQPFRRVVVDYLNLVFSNSQESRDHWNNDIYHGILARYPGSFGIDVSSASASASSSISASDDEAKKEQESNDAKLDVKDLIGARRTHVMYFVFKRTVHMTALQFSPVFMASLQNEPDFFTESDGSAIDEIDLLGVGERVKSMNVVSLAQGLLYMAKAREHRGHSNPTLALRSFRAAARRFEDAISSNPTSKIALRSCATALLYVERILEKTHHTPLSLANPNIIRADEYFRRAVDVDPNDADTLAAYANMLRNCRQYVRAELWFLLALTDNPNDYSYLYEYGSMLKYNLNLGDAGDRILRRCAAISKLMSNKSS